MKKAALYVGIIAALICGTTFAAVISGTSVGSSAVYTTPVPAQYVAASYGSALANESIAAGTDSALYCAMDNLDGTTSTPECGLNAIRHKGVGPFSDADYFSSPGVNDIFDLPASGWTVTVVWQRVLGDNQMLIGADQINVAGWYLRDRGTAGQIHLGFYPGGAAAVTAATAIGAAGTVHVATVGITATGEVKVKADGGVTQGALATGYVPATATLTAIGKAASFGGYATLGNIMEIHVASDPFVEATVAARQTSIMSCRTAGRCIPTSADEVAYFGGDDYTIGGSWCGDYPTCSAAKTFTRTGTVTTREARYSWPSLTPTQNGTVPRVATSGLHPKGYGARHASIGPFSAANYLSLGAGAAPDVLDFSDDFTECAIVEPTPTDFSGYASIISNTNATTRGYELFASADFTLRARFWLPGVADAVSSTVIPNSTIAVCWGRQGTTGKVQVGGGVVGTVATVGYLPASSAPALIGDNAARPAFAGKVHEIFATTTPASDAYLTFLTDAAMRCTTQGNCFPRDANTVMHCNGDEFTGGVLRCGVNTGADAWTTNGAVTLNAPSFYQNVNAQRISASGAGPYSSANYFQWGTGADVLDFSGSWTVCSSFDVTTASGQVINGGYDAGTQTGWAMTYVSGKLQCTVATVLGGAVSVDTSTNAGSDGSLNIGCCGWTRGSNIVSARLNASAIATQGGASFAPATTIPSYIGRRNAAGTELGGRVYEILALNKAPTTELLDTIHRRWLNHQSLTGQALSNTHTIDTSTYHSAGKVWRRGANMQRQESARSMRVLDGYNIVPPVPGPGVRLFVPPGRTFYGSYNNEVTGLTLSGTSTSVTGTPNGAVAPDGTMTALAVRDTAATADHLAYFDMASPACVGNDSYAIVVSVYIKPVGYTCIRAGITNGSVLYSDNDSVDVLGGYAYLNPDTQYGQEYLADGWIRYWWATGYFPCGGARLFVRAKAGSIPCSYTPSWAGDTSKGFDIWGLSMEVFAPVPLSPTSAPLPKPFCAYGTTCTAETVTVPNPLRPNGSDWTNLLLQSEDLATTWGVVNTAVLVNSTLSPDGSFTADKLYENDATNGVHYTLQAYTATAVPWTVSFKAKPAERSWLLVSPDAGASTASFDLSTCSAGAVSAGVTSTASASSAPGWCDFSLTKTMAAGATSVRIFLCTAAGSCSYAGVAGSGVFLWGLQAEPASSASPYCPTTTTARTCGPGGAIGKTVTNNALQSENFASASWVKTSTFTSGFLAPDGSATAWRVTATAAAESNYQLTGLASGSTFSIFAKNIDATTTAFRDNGGAHEAVITWADGSVSLVGAGTTGAATPVGDGWYRIQVGTAAAAPVLFNILTQGAGKSIYVWHPQFELGTAGAGFYCGPTAAASRTCAPKQNWCVRVKDATPGYGRKWTMTTGTVLAAGGAYNGANSWNVQAYGTKIYLDSRGADSGVAFSMNADHTFTAGSTHTIVACANNGVGTLYYDGSFTPAGTGTVATFSNWPTSTFIGSVAAGVYPWNGTIGSLDLNSTGDPRDFVWDRRTP